MTTCDKITFSLFYFLSPLLAQLLVGLLDETPSAEEYSSLLVVCPEPCLAVPFPALSLRYFILCSRLSIEVRLIKNGFVLCERRSDTQEIVCRPLLVILQKTMYAPESSSADAAGFGMSPSSNSRRRDVAMDREKSKKEKIHEPSNYSTKETLFYISLGSCFAGALAWTAAIH